MDSIHEEGQELVAGMHMYILFEGKGHQRHVRTWLGGQAVQPDSV